MLNEALWSLIAKYLAGECTEEETASIEAWLHNENNSEFFKELENTWKSHEPAYEAGNFNIHYCWEILTYKIKTYQKETYKGMTLFE